MARGWAIAATLAALLVAAQALPGHARVLGRVGAVYPIAERDALDEIEERAREIDWEKKLSRPRPEDYRPARPAHLPPAQETRSFLVDPSYRLERDLPDGRGGILYPAGYTFNPLAYLGRVPTLVVIDGDNPRHLTWLENLPLVREDSQALVLLTRGDHAALGERLGRRVFYLDGPTAERLALAAVPCIIVRRGLYLEVSEIALSSSDN